MFLIFSLLCQTGQKLLDSLADTWDFFFCDVLSMLQAIFYPVQVRTGYIPICMFLHYESCDSHCADTCACVQGKEPSVRQLALLHFRNIITLNLKLDEALSRPRARVPPSIIQMLLILQVRRPHAGLLSFFFSWCSHRALKDVAQKPLIDVE